MIRANTICEVQCFVYGLAESPCCGIASEDIICKNYNAGNLGKCKTVGFDKIYNYFNSHLDLKFHKVENCK